MKTLLILLFASVGYVPAPDRTIDAAPLKVSPEGWQLILDFEVGGGAVYYNRKLLHPTWPGESSGVTIGVGYDLGYNSREQIAQDWASLPPGVVSRLQGCAGIKGSAGRLKVAAVRDIVIPWETALAVYQRKTVPRFAKMTAAAYPGTQRMHPHVQASMLSWVFNRGAGITDSARDREKRMIRSAIPQKPADLPAQFRSSKRLWTATPGLERRREAEAKLIEASFP